jgi:Ax21 family sulfation-dependent quorum factor
VDTNKEFPMKIRHLALAAILAGTSLGATAGPNWNYVEGGYVRVNPDGVGNADGFGIRGSVAFADSWHVFGRYDEVSEGIDISRTSLGLGYNLGISERTDFVTRVAYERVDVSGFGGSVDGNGYSVLVGLRGNVTDAFTVGAGVEYTDIEDGDDTVFKLDAQYAINETFAVAFEAEAGDDGQSYFIGPRITF